MLNLLDGLRDLKAPLASGTVMLFAIWLAFANGIAAVRADESLIGNIRRLTEYLGTPATLGLIAFVAYLIGLILPLHKAVLAYGSVIFNLAFDADDNPMEDAYPFGLVLPKDTRRRFQSFVYEVMEEARDRGVSEDSISSAIDPTLGETEGPWHRFGLYRARKTRFLKRAWQRQWQWQSDWYYYQPEMALAKDVKLLAAQLHTAKEKSYEQYDKAKTEADFRAGLVLPLLLVASIACFRLSQDGLLWVGMSVLAAAVPLVAGLAVTAILRLQEANQTLVTALILGHIELPALAAIEALDPPPEQRGPWPFRRRRGAA